MTNYLLTCQCGNTVPVEVGQAGGQVTCSCGAIVEVPPLRKLRHLPLATTAADRVESSWSGRHGIVAASLILAAIPALWALWSRLSEPYVSPFDAEIRAQMIEQRLEELTPAQAWQQWIEWFRPLAERGFSRLQHPHEAEIEQYVAKARFFQKSLLVIAGALASVALVAVLWPRSRDPRA